VKIINKTGRVRHTWDGRCDVPPDGVLDTDALSDDEAKWHLRHGFVRESEPVERVIVTTTLEDVAPVELPTDPVVRRAHRKRASKKRASKRED